MHENIQKMWIHVMSGKFAPDIPYQQNAEDFGFNIQSATTQK